MDEPNTDTPPGLLGPLSNLPPTAPQGPRRRAPVYYAGETYGRRYLQYPDVERHQNGSVPGIRNKAARRLIRGAFKRKLSSVEQGLNLVRAMKAQAVEVVNDEHYDKSRSAQARRARRLLAEELAIHQPVYAPTKKQIRAMRTEARRRKRRGEPGTIDDAISAAVDLSRKP